MKKEERKEKIGDLERKHQMDRFKYLLKLHDIYEALDGVNEYPLFHLVDKVHLTYKGRKGDFITVINEEGNTQVFSLSHMYNRRLIKPDDKLFKVEFIGAHDNEVKHDVTKSIHTYDEFFDTLSTYGFDYFYLLLSVEELILSLKEKAFLSSSNKKSGYNASEFLKHKLTVQDNEIHYKENISHFVRLHYRPKDDLLLASYHAFKRQNKALVLIGLDFNLIKDEELRVYPLPNAGLDLIYDQHFYLINLRPDTFPIYSLDKYDYVAMFSSYDNHAHSTMVRGAETLVFDKLATRYIKALYFPSESDKKEFLTKIEELNIDIKFDLIIDATKFD